MKKYTLIKHPDAPGHRYVTLVEANESDKISLRIKTKYYEVEIVNDGGVVTLITEGKIPDIDKLLSIMDMVRDIIGGE